MRLVLLVRGDVSEFRLSVGLFFQCGCFVVEFTA